jgi:hypothetical protein
MPLSTHCDAKNPMNYQAVGFKSLHLNGAKTQKCKDAKDSNRRSLLPPGRRTGRGDLVYRFHALCGSDQLQRLPDITNTLCALCVFARCAWMHKCRDGRTPLSGPLRRMVFVTHCLLPLVAFATKMARTFAKVLNLQGKKKRHALCSVNGKESSRAWGGLGRSGGPLWISRFWSQRVGSR